MSDETERLQTHRLKPGWYVNLYGDDDILIGHERADRVDEQVVLEPNQTRELARLLQGPISEGEVRNLGNNKSGGEATLKDTSDGSLELTEGDTTLDISAVISPLVETLLSWGVAFNRPPGSQHNTRKECIAEERYLDHDIQSNLGEHARDVRVYCPVCGRTYQHVYEYRGLWDEQLDDYVWG